MRGCFFIKKNSAVIFNIIAYRDVLKKYNLNLEEDGYKKHFSGKSIQGGLVEFLYSVNVSFIRVNGYYLSLVAIDFKQNHIVRKLNRK